MTDAQFRFILYAAVSYLLGNILAWGLYGVYLWHKGAL